MKSFGNSGSGVGAHPRLASVAKCIGNCPRDVPDRAPGLTGHTPQFRNRGIVAPALVSRAGAGAVPAPCARGSGGHTGEGVVWRQDFEEHFSVGELIGEGQQGAVRNVVSNDTGALHAVKVLPRENAAGSSRPDTEKKMRSEANFHQRLQGCPAVARMFGAYEDDEHLYIVMERFDAGSMADVLQEVGHFSEAESAELMWGMLRFLEHSHEHGICYGDVKPANFMLSSPCKTCPTPCNTGRLQGLSVRAIDFGCCQQMIPGLHLRRAVGSPIYMAPEIHLERYGVEADLWSAGVTMYQLLSGRLPFTAYDDNGEITDYGIRLGYSFESEVWDSVSDEAKDLISQLLVRAPMKRISASKALSHPWFTKAGMLLPNINMESSSIVAAPEKVSTAQSAPPAVGAV